MASPLKQDNAVYDAIFKQTWIILAESIHELFDFASAFATLDSHLPETANLNNPVDVIGDASQDRYENALSAVIKD